MAAGDDLTVAGGWAAPSVRADTPEGKLVADSNLLEPMIEAGMLPDWRVVSSMGGWVGPTGGNTGPTIPAVSVRRDGIQWPQGIVVRVTFRVHRPAWFRRCVLSMDVHQTFTINGVPGEHDESLPIARYWRRSKAIATIKILRLVGEGALLRKERT